MSAYIRRLIEGSAARAEALAKAKRDLDDVRDRMTPLIERLRRLLDDVPREMQSAGLPLRQLQEGLKGRQQGLCSAAELAVSLRELGWFKHRFVRETHHVLWFPPWVNLPKGVRGKSKTSKRPAIRREWSLRKPIVPKP